MSYDFFVTLCYFNPASSISEVASRNAKQQNQFACHLNFPAA